MQVEHGGTDELSVRVCSPSRSWYMKMVQVSAHAAHFAYSEKATRAAPGIPNMTAASSAKPVVVARTWEDADAYVRENVGRARTLACDEGRTLHNDSNSLHGSEEGPSANVYESGCGEAYGSNKDHNKRGCSVQLQGA